MASKKPTQDDRADEIDQFLAQILPEGRSGKGRAPQLDESFQRDTFRELTRKVLFSPFEVFDTVQEEGGDAAIDAALMLDLATALYLGQAAMWHAVARLLGESSKRTEQQVNSILAYFHLVFIVECVPVLKGKEGIKLRKPEQFAAVIDRLETKYWSELPGRPGRPPRKGKRARDLPASFFKQVDDVRELLVPLRRNVVKPYLELLGKDAWESGRAWKRILDPGYNPEPFEHDAQDHLKRIVESMGYWVHMLGNKGFQLLFNFLFRYPPKEAALRFQALRASLRYQHPISYREMKDEYYARKGKR
jgi:hypothetical protein